MNHVIFLFVSLVPRYHNEMPFDFFHSRKMAQTDHKIALSNYELVDSTCRAF